MNTPKHTKPFARRKPLFVFDDMPAAGGFTFEKLHPQNCEALYRLFECDESQFTDNRFKQYDTVKEYADFMEEWGAFMPKHGGQDWYFKMEDNYVGILHLYDLSLEQFAGHNKRAWIGFAITPAWRNKGIMKKALKIFVEYVFAHYKNIDHLYAMTIPSNEASINTLFAAGFKEHDEDWYEGRYRLFVMGRHVVGE